MKKFMMSIIIIALCLSVVFSFAACQDKPQNGDDNDQPGDELPGDEDPDDEDPDDLPKTYIDIKLLGRVRDLNYNTLTDFPNIEIVFQNKGLAWTNNGLINEYVSGREVIPTGTTLQQITDGITLNTTKFYKVVPAAPAIVVGSTTNNSGTTVENANIAYFDIIVSDTAIGETIGIQRVSVVTKVNGNNVSLAGLVIKENGGSIVYTTGMPEVFSLNGLKNGTVLVLEKEGYIVESIIVKYSDNTQSTLTGEDLAEAIPPYSYTVDTNLDRTELTFVMAEIG